MCLSRGVEPSGGSGEGGGFRRERSGEGGYGEGSDPARGGFLVSLFGEVSGHLHIGAMWADGIAVFWDKLGYMGIASVGEKGGLPGGEVGFGEGPGVTVTDVIHGVDPGEVRMEGGAVIWRLGRGRGFLCGLRGGGDRGQGCLGALWGGCGGAVLIRCHRSCTDEVMGAIEAVISSLFGTEFATELTES